MEFKYEELLDRAWKYLPEKLKNPSRFRIPEAISFVEGNQTIIKNFNEIANVFGREPRHLLLFLIKELAAPGNYDGKRAIINRAVRREVINKKIETYAKEYVLCHECGRPDTRFTELEGEKIVKCDACGGWWPLRKIK
ncbi:MAG: translation initiation factor IF-2 subunit beta [Candidatus Altiarchaeales archaeon]|nr:MAG: translation initiation factor IF-2 subunit beta [Candidatus Altiarchaeales archaeon]